MPTGIDDWRLHEPLANPRDTDIRRSPSPGSSRTPSPPPSPLLADSDFLGWLGQMPPTPRVLTPPPPPPRVQGRGRPLTDDWFYAAVPHSSAWPAGLVPDAPADMSSNPPTDDDPWVDPWHDYPPVVTRTQIMPFLVHSPAAVPPLAASRPAPPPPLPAPLLRDTTTTTTTAAIPTPHPLFAPANPPTRQRSQTPPRRNIRPRLRARPCPQQQQPADPADLSPPTQLTAAALQNHEAATDRIPPPWRQPRGAASAVATAGGYGDLNPYAAPAQPRLAPIADTPAWQHQQEARDIAERVRMYQVTEWSGSGVGTMPPSPPPPEPLRIPTVRRAGLTPQQPGTPPSHPRPMLHPPCRCPRRSTTTPQPQPQLGTMAEAPPPPQPEAIPTVERPALSPQADQRRSYTHPTLTYRLPGPPDTFPPGPAPTALTAAALRQHDALYPWLPPSRGSRPPATNGGEQRTLFRRRLPPTPPPRAGGFGIVAMLRPPAVGASPVRVAATPRRRPDPEEAARWVRGVLLDPLVWAEGVSEVPGRGNGGLGSGVTLAGDVAAAGVPEVEMEVEAEVVVEEAVKVEAEVEVEAVPTLLGTAEMLEGLAAEMVRGGGVSAAWAGVERALGALQALQAAAVGADNGRAKAPAEVVVGAVAGGCVLCYVRVADSVFRPCGHLVLCAECVLSERVGGGVGGKWPTVRCPVGRCGAEVVAAVKVFWG